MAWHQQEEPDPVVITSLRFTPFVSCDQVTSKCTTSLALKNISEKERKRLVDHLWHWIDSSDNLSGNHTASTVLSPAALALCYLQLHPRLYRPLILHVDAETYPPELRISLPQRSIPTSPGEIVRSNPVLQAIFWHQFRIAKQSSFPSASSEINRCGFIGCNSACCPQPSTKLLDFHLDRVYHDHTLATYKSDSHLRERRLKRLSVASTSPLLSLPDDVLFRIVLNLSGVDITRLSETCSTFFEFLLPIVPGLRLRLFPHQLHALRRLTAMEQLRVRSDGMPLLEHIKYSGHNGSCLAVDLVDGSILCLHACPSIGPTPGGLFCDEPGLGKTITALALILKTNGQFPSTFGQTIFTVKRRDGSHVNIYKECVVERLQSYAQDTTRFPDRKSRLLPNMRRQRVSSRSIRHPDYLGLGRSDAMPSAHEAGVQSVYLSSATLVIVPHVLVAHWSTQITQHVDRGTLRVLYLKCRMDCPKSPADIACNYDLIVASFDVIRAIHIDMRCSAPALMRVHFLRIIVDEGHNLSSASVTNFIIVCERLRAQSRWVMTGTPTPSTPRSDVDHLFSLLRFIREESFGTDRGAWDVGIRAPYLQFKIEGLERLGSLLKRVMIRGDKNVLSVKCEVRNVILDFSEASAKSYNGLVRTVRRNLITSDWFSEDHKESLLNPRNYREAEDLFKNLKLACCFGGTMNMRFSDNDIAESLDVIYERHREVAKLSELDRFADPTYKLGTLDAVDGCLSEEERADVLRNEEVRLNLLNEGRFYTRLSRSFGGREGSRIRKTYEPTIYAGRLHVIAEAFTNCQCLCDRCGKNTMVPMVTPCGHLLCDECIVLDQTGCVAKNCGTEYMLDSKGVPEELVELQPSIFSNAWVSTWEDTESAKLDYLIGRISQLPRVEEWGPGYTEPKLVPPKVIVHSEYGDHLKMVALKLKQSELKDCYAEMTWNATEIEVGYKGRRASEIAENSVEQFRNNDSIYILLMNTRHGGVGLDLSFVRYIFMLEPVWDASVELQIISRAHRIGCKHDILVERLVMRNSVEEAMLRESKAVLRTSEINVSGVAAVRKERDRQRRVDMLRTLRTVLSKQEMEDEKEASNSAKRIEIRLAADNDKDEMGIKRGATPERHDEGNEVQKKRRVRFEL